MPVTVIVGGQYGSEGKGKVAHFFAREMDATVAIRVGGPNSGHTVIGPDGKPIIFKQLPTAALLPDVICVLPAGSYIEPDILLEEIRIAGLNPSRVLIDPNAVVITEREHSAESASDLGPSIGSTLSGTGAGVLARIQRLGAVRFARDVEVLRPYVQAVTPFLRNRLDKKERILIEGTQGFGLSVLHTPYYPYATSRDTTAAGFVAEAGLSPLDVDDVVMVIRTFPIRVPGNSGPLPNETSWAEVTRESKSRTPLSELTSVTRKERRVAKFDPDIVRDAIALNCPTRIVLNHVDYVDADCADLGQVTPTAMTFLQSIEAEIGRRIDYIGYCRSLIWPYPHLQQPTDRDFPKDDKEAEMRFEEFERIDPFPKIPAALLNSADISDYTRVTGMVWPFEPDPTKGKLKSASYEIDFLGDLHLVTGSDNYEVRKIRHGDVCELPQNSISFLFVETTFRLPYYIAARFNLRIALVHAGLLVGTGPLIDPGFAGRLLVPLHNLTSESFRIVGGEGLFWVEFTKLSPIMEPLGDRKGVYNPFPRDKRYRDAITYFEKASRTGRAEPASSSIPDAVLSLRRDAQHAKESAENANKSASDASNKVEEMKARITVGGIAGLAALLLSLVGLYWTVLGLIRDTTAELIDKTGAISIRDVEGRVKKLEETKKEAHKSVTLDKALEEIDMSIKNIEDRIARFEKSKTNNQK